MFERKSIAFIVFVILRNAVKISWYLGVVCLCVFSAHHMKQYKYIPHYSILDLQCLENEKTLHNFVAAVSKCQHESKLEICRTLTDE